MYRSKQGRSSRKSFNRRASKTDRVNTMNPRRGGFRL